MPLASSPTSAVVSGVVDDVAARMLDTLLRALPRVALAVGVVLLAWLLARLLRAVLRRVLRGHRTPSFVNVMTTLTGWVVVAVGVLSAVTIVFPSVRPVDVLGGLGFFSIAVGFAFQDILENTLSGVLMLFRQPFRSGDQIEVQGQTGTVQAISIRETRIRTYDGQLVLIPNRDVYKNVIRVQTHYERRRLAFVVGIAYENDAREATRVVVAALADVPGVLADPGPEALVQTLGVSTVDLEVRFWCAPQQHEARLALDAAIVAVKRALDAAGIEMPADIVALQATPSFRAALQGDADVTPGGSVRPADHG
ncbi:mechanosensitive ion channel family protein [Phycicoccus flavus]|uniref:mechanosensitive ion channel family protein n=1 Tax=Phycicoccus flavus TaxID=2502783 RepID=UPI000FEBDF4D|nr:mechanosensitive ion channel family protein [Phycicoccus flavus]NHA66673.1 mechanosensitive ion channel family protein [Phycicoccus flavus]